MVLVDVSGVMGIDERDRRTGTEHVVRNRAVWDALSRYYFESGSSFLGRRHSLGDMGHARRDAAHSPRCCRKGRRRAGLRDRISFRLAREGWGAGPRYRQFIRAAQDGDDISERVRASFPLIQGDAERAPLIDGSFDMAISEYGASVWCDPYRWIPEASRLLRPGGLLIFMVGGTILWLCEPDTLKDAPRVRNSSATISGCGASSRPRTSRLSSI